MCSSGVPALVADFVNAPASADEFFRVGCRVLPMGGQHEQMCRAGGPDEDELCGALHGHLGTLLNVRPRATIVRDPTGMAEARLGLCVVRMTCTGAVSASTASSDRSRSRPMIRA